MSNSINTWYQGIWSINFLKVSIFETFPNINHELEYKKILRWKKWIMFLLLYGLGKNCIIQGSNHVFKNMACIQKMGHPCTTPRQKMHLPQFQNSKTSVKNLLIFYRTLEMLNDGSYTFIKCGNLLNFHCFWPCQSFQSSISMSRATVGWKSNNSIAQKNIKHNQNSHYTVDHFSTLVPKKRLRIDIKQGGSVPGESNPNT